MPDDIGFDKAFYQTYDQMNDKEKELFHVIRGTTTHSVYRLNQKLREWTDSHRADELCCLSPEHTQTLDRDLIQLRLYLNGWFSKYESIIKTSRKRSLVYSANQNEMGFEFPAKIKNNIEMVLRELNFKPRKTKRN